MDDCYLLPAMEAQDVSPRTKPCNCLEPFCSRMKKREKRPTGDLFGLQISGVNLSRIALGGESALMHAYSSQDEMTYVVIGHPTLVTEPGKTALSPGMCAGFRARGEAHHVANRSDENALILEIGDRTKGDAVWYSRDDLQAVLDDEGKWRFVHKDGSPYETS